MRRGWEEGRRITVEDAEQQEDYGKLPQHVTDRGDELSKTKYVDRRSGVIMLGNEARSGERKSSIVIEKKNDIECQTPSTVSELTVNMYARQDTTLKVPKCKRNRLVILRGSSYIWVPGPYTHNRFIWEPGPYMPNAKYALSKYQTTKCLQKKDYDSADPVEHETSSV